MYQSTTAGTRITSIGFQKREMCKPSGLLAPAISHQAPMRLASSGSTLHLSVASQSATVKLNSSRALSVHSLRLMDAMDRSHLQPPQKPIPWSVHAAMAPSSSVAGPLPDPTSILDGLSYEKGSSIGSIPHRGMNQANHLQPAVLHINGQPNGQHAPQARLLTVDEALKYSPLSSIVPFSSGKEPAQTTSSWC